MKYAAVLKYNKKDETVTVCVLSETPSMTPLQYLSDLSFSDLSKFVRQNKLTPINFSINRNGNIEQDCGDFNRFNKADTLVLLAEYVDKDGNNEGYKTLSTANGKVFNLKMEYIVELYQKSTTKIVFQNAIMKCTGGTYSISCYPMKPFIQIVLKNTKDKATKTVKTLNQSVNTTPKVDKKQEKVKPVKQSVKKVEDKKELSYNKKQEKELDKCVKAGIDPKLLADKRLTAQQMRILWYSKKTKGVLSEYFNSADYSEDVMKFYADRLYTKSKAKAYKKLLDRPNLTVEQLQELTECIEDGIEYEDLLDLSAEDIYCKKVERDPKFWDYSEFGRVTPSDTWKQGELFELMMLEAMRLKGLS